MEAELKALVAACRGKYGSADKALRGIIFDFRKEWETQEAVAKAAAEKAAAEAKAAAESQPQNASNEEQPPAVE